MAEIKLIGLILVGIAALYYGSLILGGLTFALWRELIKEDKDEKEN
jgi:hypothetical protein